MCRALSVCTAAIYKCHSPVYTKIVAYNVTLVRPPLTNSIQPSRMPKHPARYSVLCQLDFSPSSAAADPTYSRLYNLPHKVSTVRPQATIEPVTLQYCDVTWLSKSRLIFMRSDDLNISPIYHRPDVSLSK